MEVKNKKVVIKVIRWLLFSVCFAILPFIFNVISGLSRGLEFNIVSLFGNGQLLLVSTTLCAVAAGELFGVNSTNSIISHLAGGGVVILIALTSFYYADVSYGGDDLKRNVVAWFSIWLFVISVLVSTASIFITSVMED